MRRILSAASAFVLVLLLTPSAAAAQEGFFFGPPRTQLTLRPGMMLHGAGGDLFHFFRSELTLGRGDLVGPSLAGEIGIFGSSRMDLLVSFGVSSAEAGSESRDWLDEDDQPIEQTTSLRVMPLTASLRFYPLSRGQRISSLAWIPARTTPYLGAGGGVAWYRLRQVGDFVEVDPQTDTAVIFSDDYLSSSSTGIGHVFGGVEHWLSRRVGLSLEGRYTIGKATPGGDFQSWDSLDLSGFQVSLGASYRW